MAKPRRKHAAPTEIAGADEMMVFQLKRACETAGLHLGPTYLNRIVFALGRQGYGIWSDDALDGG